MRKKDEDRRAEKRSPFRTKIKYSLDLADGEEEKGTEGDPIENFTSDISFRGMSLYSEHPAEAGQKIKIILRHVFKEPIVGEVRWCQKEVNGLYKLGIKCR